MMNRLDLQQTGKILMDAQRIALTIHMSPDGDAIGGSLALARVLTQLGKEVTIFVDDIIKGFKFLPDLNKIKTSVDLDRITEPLQFDLLCILDCSTLARIGRVAEKVTAQTKLNIDHHVSNNGFVENTYLDGDAAATAEIIGALVKEMEWPLDKVTADCLFTGLYTDCGSFAYSCTRPETMQCGAELLAAGAEPHKIDEALDVMSPVTMSALVYVLNNLQYTFGGRVAYMWMDLEMYEKIKDTADTENFINFPRRIEGVELAVFFKEVEPEKTRVSMRSKNIDVAEIAMLFNGGGHARAAGGTIRLPLKQAIATFLETIGERLI
ncbi:MAG: bifunctional oligoribonuclease/PAP phosphatase NrnA [Phascolarctobacterium sp.]|nr:bifunctional oligoribonuclease/PAP phosphatase NrnA [Candidatus Phascolarctobacterium equi]